MSIYDYFWEGCNGSMFLSPVDEQEIIRTVQQFKLPVFNQIESVVKYASKLIGLNMPSIRSLYLSRSLRKSKRIVQDEYHPANHLFELLPSGKRYRSIKN